VKKRRAKGPPIYRFYSPRINRAFDRGDKRRALRLARHYAYFYPQDPNSWSILGDVLLRMEKPAEAEKALREGAFRHSWDRLHYRLGQLLLSLDRFDEVRDIADKLSRRSPKSPVPSLLLAQLAGQDEDRPAYVSCSRAAADRLEAASHPWDLQTAHRVALMLLYLPEERGRAVVILRLLAEDYSSGRLHALVGFLLEVSDPDSSARYLAQARILGASTEDFEDMSKVVRRASEEVWTEDEETVDA
jgi:tetratricopeptide (TPR) repeat protein